MAIDDYDAELQDAIYELSAAGALDEKSDGYGIAQQVITRGIGSLSERQRHVYDRDVQPLLDEWYDENRTIQIMNSAAP